MLKYNKLMKNTRFMILCVMIFLSQVEQVMAQDERFTRKLLSGDLTRIDPLQSESKYTYRARSSYYEIDINGDNRNESFVIEKKDGEDWFHVYSYKKEKLYSYKLDPGGFDSRLYRITTRKLSSNTNVYILHYFEGVNRSLKFRSQARFYFLTIDGKDLSTLATYKGPAYWEEFKSFKHNHYHQREYVLTAIDLNKDGIKELSLSYNQTKRVFFYAGKGSWLRF